ncbi:MAG: DUF3325 domain-containing protein [Luteolibacter sp.]
MMILTFAWSFIAVVLFALGMKSHHRAMLRRDPGKRESFAFKVAGGAALGILFWSSAYLTSLEVGVTSALICLAVCGLLLTFLLAYWPRLALAGAIFSVAVIGFF